MKIRILIDSLIANQTQMKKYYGKLRDRFLSYQNSAEKEKIKQGNLNSKLRNTEERVRLFNVHLNKIPKG